MNKNSGDKKTKLEYFMECTEDQVNTPSYFKNLEQDSINPILYNPKELFKEFIDEIERKNLSNPDSKKFFIENTNNLNTLELNALEFLKPTLKIIQQQFNEKDFSYLHHVLKFALEEMNDFRLGKECVKELSKILFNDASLEDNKEYIKHLVRFIVFELHDKGFSAEKINRILNDLFVSYSNQGMMGTRFPHNLEFPENPTQENKEKYYQDLKAYMDSLTDKDRIEAINNYFSKKAFPAKFIFRANGIKGKENLTIGDIEIYNPLKNPLTEGKYDETFGLSDEEKVHQSEICNIAISVDVVDGEFGKHQAILKANTFFDCFASNIFSTKTKILIDTTYYLVLNQKNEEIGNGFRAKDEHLNYIFSKQIKGFKDTKNKYLPYFEKLIKQDGVEIDKQIKKSLSWKKRALEATNYNEAILWHWISIENLFNSQRDTTKLIFHFAPKILTKAYIHHFIQQVWNQLCYKADFFGNYAMPQEAQKIIINRMSSTMTYKEFIEKVKKNLPIS